MTITCGYDANGQQISVDRPNGLSTTTTSLWDTGSGLSQLVDDGSTSYLQAGGVRELDADRWPEAARHGDDAQSTGQPSRHKDTPAQEIPSG